MRTETTDRETPLVNMPALRLKRFPRGTFMLVFAVIFGLSALVSAFDVYTVIFPDPHQPPPGGLVTPLVICAVTLVLAILSARVPFMLRHVPDDGVTYFVEGCAALYGPSGPGVLHDTVLVSQPGCLILRSRDGQEQRFDNSQIAKISLRTPMWAFSLPLLIIRTYDGQRTLFTARRMDYISSALNLSKRAHKAGMLVPGAGMAITAPELATDAKNTRDVDTPLLSLLRVRYGRKSSRWLAYAEAYMVHVLLPVLGLLALTQVVMVLGLMIVYAAHGSAWLSVVVGLAPFVVIEGFGIVYWRRRDYNFVTQILPVNEAAAQH